jgi:hypothetical protein
MTPDRASLSRRYLDDAKWRWRLVDPGTDKLMTAHQVLRVSRLAWFIPVLVAQQLADALARYMNMLGLQRRAKAVPSLGDYLASGAATVLAATKKRHTAANRRRDQFISWCAPRDHSWAAHLRTDAAKRFKKVANATRHLEDAAGGGEGIAIV